MIFVLRGEALLALNFDAVVNLAKRLQLIGIDALKVECKALIPQVIGHAAPKLSCPVAWLLTDKGCTKSKESEQVLNAARQPGASRIETC